MLTVVGLVFALCTVRGVRGQCFSQNDNPTSFGPSSNQSLTQARFDFALDALGKVAERERRDNIFFSPHSLHEALILTYLSASGTTESSSKSALRIPATQSKSEVQRFYRFENTMRQYRERSSNDSSRNEFRTVNKLWVTDQHRVKRCMLDLFGDQLEQVNFRGNPEGVRQTINEWVSHVTDGHIRDLVASGGVTSRSDLILANAVYFKGLWLYPFDTLYSKEDYFNTNNLERTLVTYMRQHGSFVFGVSNEIGARVLVLPYRGKDESMYALLPIMNNPSANERGENNTDDVGQLIRQITMTQKGRAAFQSLLEQSSQSEPRFVRVSLPKFSVDRQLPVEDLLNSLGAGELLTANANLRALMVEGEPDLHLGSAVHRAVIDVTEEGTIASGATALTIQKMAPPSIRFNRPFLYFIYKKSLRSILFAGVYRIPEKS